MGDERQCFRAVIIIISIVLSIVFVTLNLVWLFKVMNNSNKEEPSQEKRISLLNANIDGYLNHQNEECLKMVNQFIDEGIYETFNFKIKHINKYSKGLLSLFFIQIGIVFLIIIGIIIFIILDSEEK